MESPLQYGIASRETRTIPWVSILVLVESPLQSTITTKCFRCCTVSILVLVESPLQSDWLLFDPFFSVPGFNPCFSGISSSMLVDVLFADMRDYGFNPCFSGISSSILFSCIQPANPIQSFNPCFSGISSSILQRLIPPRPVLLFQSLF